MLGLFGVSILGDFAVRGFFLPKVLIFFKRPCFSIIIFVIIEELLPLLNRTIVMAIKVYLAKEMLF